MITSESQLQQKDGGGTMDATVQVGQSGSLTLPASILERYKVKPGDTFKILDLDGIFVLMPMTPIVLELAREIERARVEAGLSVEEMLTSLREQRERYVREKYGQPRQ
jgi:bifunctional DNA-binding transcriptional regulator/antitoxin component of YhaV-PrlF toxin-antitoxin module